MKHNEDYLDIAGFQELYYQVWQPEKDIQGVILLIHGLGEHGGRYGTHFADFYTSSGFALVVPDLPGHGKTLGPRGHISDNALFLDHIDHFLQKSKELFPGKPIFIYGHSMGGLLVLWYDLARNPQVNGLIVTSPGIHTKDPIAPAKRTLAIALNAILPSFTMKNGLDANLLSHDPEIVSAYRTDPLVHDKTSARMGMLFINRGDWVLEHAPQNKADILLMIGSEEGIVNKEAVDQFSKIAPHVDYKIWPGFFHEIHNEPGKLEVYTYTLNWIKRHI